MPPIAVIDFETTGMSPGQGARATEVAIVLLESGKVVDRFQSLMKTGAWIPPFITELTGITNAMVQEAPEAASVMRDAARFVGDAPMVAHNASFDSKFWQAELALADTPAPQPFACTVLLSRRLYPQAPTHKLGPLVQHLGLPRAQRAHRALADAEMAAALLARMQHDLATQWQVPGADFALLQGLQRCALKALPQWLQRQAKAKPPTAPVPLGADGQAHALLIVHADRAIAPTPALRQVVEFEDNGQGGFISAAQALDGRWGYIDAQGQWLIAPTLDNARGFSDDGLARFCRDGRWGYIDLLAQEAIAAQFEDARPLRNGLAAVKTGQHCWRIIDRQGRFTCESTFHQLDNFGAVGLALAEQWDPRSNQRLRGYVDHQGRWVIAARFAQARAFDDHAVTAASVDGETWGLIDAEGAWVLKPCYPCIEAFNSEGLAFYDEQGSWDNGHGYLNTRGKVVVKGGRHLSRHMACAVVADSYDGTRFVDAHGKLLQGPALSYASDFRAETECA
eukprot:gene15496-15306_t